MIFVPDEGLEFLDRNLGPMLLKKWGSEWWLFKKHPDGQWVSHRRATETDLKRLDRRPPMPTGIECETCQDYWWLWEGLGGPVCEGPQWVWFLLASELDAPMPCPDCNPGGVKKGKDSPGRARAGRTLDGRTHNGE